MVPIVDTISEEINTPDDNENDNRNEKQKRPMVRQAGAELGQAQAKLELGYD